jgi:hypothetical protein
MPRWTSSGPLAKRVTRAVAASTAASTSR